jgi:hypothetical protein
MTTSFDQNTRSQMTENWDKVRTRLQTKFPDMPTSAPEWEAARNDPESLVAALCAKTGRNEDQIRSEIQSTVAESS